MKNTPIHYGILLALLTIVLFFATYYLFIGFNYYIVSLRVNVFVLPFLYTLIAVILLYKITSIRKLSFAECFKTSFITLFTGGTLSLLFILFFLNYVDPDAQTLLQHQRIEKEFNDLNDAYRELEKPTQEQVDYYNGMIKYYSSDIAKNDPLFNLRKSFTIFTGIYLFYLIISVFLSIFFRLRNPDASLHSNSPAQRS